MQNRVKICFVCHGNICRSTMAEFVMKNLVRNANLISHFDIFSRATSREEIGNDTHYKTKEILRKYNIPFAARAAKQITKDEFNTSDFIICMDRLNLRNLNSMFGKSDKIYFMMDFVDLKNRYKIEIDDPYYTGDFETTYAQINLACNRLFEHIKNHLL